jgi:hypothetical protein
MTSYTSRPRGRQPASRSSRWLSVRAVNRVAVRVVQVGSREAVAVRRVAKVVRVAANKGAAGSRGAAARRVVGKGVRVAEAVREARGSDKVAGRASLVDVRVREVVRGKKAGAERQLLRQGGMAQMTYRLVSSVTAANRWG